MWINPETTRYYAEAIKNAATKNGSPVYVYSCGGAKFHCATREVASLTPFLIGVYNADVPVSWIEVDLYDYVSGSYYRRDDRRSGGDGGWAGLAELLQVRGVHE
jgi:hypothetical protein